MFMGILIFTTGVVTMSLAAVWQHTRRLSNALASPITGDPVTILKPLCGADDGLEENLESFFLQAYPRLQIVFGVQGRDDPAIRVVHGLRERYPSIDSRLVIHDGGWSINPKVSNLRAMLGVARHDHVIISDSNIRVTPTYVAEMMTAMTDGVGLVTSLFVGSREQSLGAALENLYLTGSVAPPVAVSERFRGRLIAVGKSMLFQRSVFDSLGGFESVGAVLAEDYIIGRMFRAAGYRAALAPHIIENICHRTTLAGFAKRALRWSALRCRLKPLAYPFELLTLPAGSALVAAGCGAPTGWVLLWAIGLTWLRDAGACLLMRPTPQLPLLLCLSLVKDLILLFVWFMAPFCHHISWRGNHVTLSMGTRLYAGSPMPGSRSVCVH